MHHEFERWFATEILSHEASLTRYLNGILRRSVDVPDLRQEIHVRMYGSRSRACGRRTQESTNSFVPLLANETLGGVPGWAVERLATHLNQVDHQLAQRTAVLYRMR